MRPIYFTFIIFVAFCLTTYAQRNKEPFRFPTESNDIRDICFTQNGKAIGIGDNKSVKIFTTDTHELIRTFEGCHNSRILSIDISGDSTYLVSGGKDSTVAIWDFRNNRLLHAIKCKGIVISVCLSPDNQFVAFGGTDKEVTVFNISKGSTSYMMTDFSNDITSLAFSPDGRYLASSSGDKNIRIYEEGTLITTLSGHKDWIRDFSFNSEGTKIVSCDDDGKVILWNISDIIKPVIENESKISLNWLLSIDFYMDGFTYAIGEFNGNAKIIGPFANYKMNIKSPINEISFKPDGKYMTIAAATADKGVLLIEATQMKY